MPHRAQQVSKCYSTAQRRTFWNCSFWDNSVKRQRKDSSVTTECFVQCQAAFSSLLDPSPLLHLIVSRGFSKLSSYLDWFKVLTLVSKSSRNRFKVSLSKVEETSKREMVWWSEQEGKTQRPPQAELRFLAWIPTTATKYTVPLSRVIVVL